MSVAEGVGQRLLWHKRQRQPAVVHDDMELMTLITAIFEESRGTNGSPRVTAALRQRGRVCNRKRVARLMRRHGRAARPRRRRVPTTNSRHGWPVTPNHLNRQFWAERPNQKWVADITYIPTAEGWLYLALVLDVFSRKIVGWAMDSHQEKSLVEQALRMALSQRQPAQGTLLHHSDRGSQYASLSYQQLLATAHITASMSRPADPYDNALMESCISTLKIECANQVFPLRSIARSELFAYLEGWYNRRRLHSALGYLSPDQFEHRFFQDNFSLHSTG